MGRLLDEDIVIDALIGISGSKNIEELTEECEVYQSDNRCYSGGVYGAIRAIKTLPTAQPEPQWIPIAERLPKDGTWNIFTDGKNISVERYKADAIDHFFPPGRWFDLDDAVAWIPLPAPYAEVVGDDES